MKRKLYAVEYVQRLEKLNRHVAVYQQLNQTNESKLLLIFAAFLKGRPQVDAEFVTFAREAVKDDASFAAVLEEMDKLGKEIAALVQGVGL